MTRAIFGRNGSVSSEPVDLPLFSESKSQPPQSSELLPERRRTCRLCATEKPYSAFYVNSKGNRRWGCMDCDRASERKRKRSDPVRTAARQKAWRQEFRGYALVNVAKHRAKARGMDFDLDPADIQRRIEVGCCELTGIPFDLSAPRSWNAPSLDRINSDCGYTTDNVRVVLYALNVMANTWGPNLIVEIAAAISARRKEASNDLSERIAERLKARLQPGSTLFRQTWKRKVTPSGRVYWAHTASGHRTSGSEFGSWPTPDAGAFGIGDPRWQERREEVKAKAINGNGFGLTLGMAATLAPWPTPCQQDGPKGGPGQGADRLPAAAALSGWHTPVVRDHRNSAGDGTNPRDLPRQASGILAPWATPKVATGAYQYSSGDHSKIVLNLGQARGVISSGSPAETEKPGQLNPAFSLWLMGYPTEWALCAARVTLSTRGRRQK